MHKVLTIFIKRFSRFISNPIFYKYCSLPQNWFKLFVSSFKNIALVKSQLMIVIKFTSIKRRTLIHRCIGHHSQLHHIQKNPIEWIRSFFVIIVSTCYCTKWKFPLIVGVCVELGQIIKEKHGWMIAVFIADLQRNNEFYLSK